MRTICLAAATVLVTAFQVKGAENLTVVDASDNTSLIGATVFSSSGSIIGITDEEGRIDLPNPKSFPVTVKCLGYNQAVVDSDVSILRMTTATYPLGEVTVTPYDRPVMKVVCYIREFTSGENTTDTLQCFSEHMADLYIPVTKIKKFKGRKSPRILTSRVYERHATSDGKDTVRIPNYRRDDISWIDLVTFPTDKLEEPDEMKAGATYSECQGKRHAKTIHRKNGQLYTTNIDYLADKKDHCYSPAMFKLLGFTIDITEMRGAWAFKQNDSGVYGPSDLLYGTFSLDITGKGRWLKKAFNSQTPVELHAFYEIYPVEMEYLTVDEAVDQQKNAPSVRFKRSPLAAPLSPAIESIVTRARAR